MPGRNGTAQMGTGVNGIGRGMGNCAGTNARRDFGKGLMLGLGCCAAAGLGLGNRFGRGRLNEKKSKISRKELLEQQKEVLQSRLNAVSSELESM